MVVRCARRAVAEGPGGRSPLRIRCAGPLSLTRRRTRLRCSRAALLGPALSRARAAPGRSSAEASAPPTRRLKRWHCLGALACVQLRCSLLRRCAPRSTPAASSRQRGDRGNDQGPVGRRLSAQGTAFGLFALARLRAPAPRAAMRGDDIASPLIESGAGARTRVLRPTCWLRRADPGARAGAAVREELRCAESRRARTRRRTGPLPPCTELASAVSSPFRSSTT